MNGTPRALFFLANRLIRYSLKALVLWLMLWTSVALSEVRDNNQFMIYLTQEKITLTQTLKQQALSEPITSANYQQLVRENNALLALTKAKIDSFENFLLNRQAIQTEYSEKLKQLQALDREKPLTASTQAMISEITTLNIVQKKIMTLIEEDIALLKRYQDYLLEDERRLTLWGAKNHLEQQLNQLHHASSKLTSLLQTFYARSLHLQSQLNESLPFDSLYLVQAKLLLNNQLINFTQYKIIELNLQEKLAKADYLLLQSPDIRTLQTVTLVYQDAINQFSEMESSLKSSVGMLKKETLYVHNEQVKEAFVSLAHSVSTKVAAIVIQQQTLEEDLERHQQSLKKQLAVRQSLSEYRVGSWPIILSQTSHIPVQFYSYLKNLLFKVYDNYEWLDFWPALLMWILLGLVIIAAVALSRILKTMINASTPTRLSAHVYDGLLMILSRNVRLLVFSLSLILLFYFNGIPSANYYLLFNLIVVWFLFRSLIFLSRFVLLERLTDDDSGHDVQLYLRIKWLLLVGGATSALMVFSHLLPLSLLLQDLFSRFFMLFLVAVSLVAWRSRNVITHLLHPILKNKKRYLQRAIFMLVVLVPITLFTTAIIGLIGYINLAWTMSGYQIKLLMLLALYVLLRGLMFDALELISERMVSHLNNGWLWVEVLLKPLDKIMRLLLLALSIYSLFVLFGWGSNSAIVASLMDFYHYSLVNLSGIHITTKSLIHFVALMCLFIWASKWTREFCYRWLYREARDNGVRNSLAVFTQYGVILIGTMMTLHVLGFDFSGMSMVLGGLAVGMGFGLRDFASNIIGGLMLLIERPVREGDVITIDNYEGKVAHIGIRSMRLCSWDNMEVLIPNAETFNKPFTNWTHQDSIVRTVISIKVSRLDDPGVVQQLIFDVLQRIPEVLNEPVAQVYLMQINEALIEFEVRYFINVALHSRVEIRSKVLFAIMAQFKAAGVKSPIPPIEIELKESEAESRLV